ncbi:phage/plasmid primase, P4 family [Candidatus Caldatribacterium saccharofermentans]|uniref:phage/plasmid primase, P4 family n=1 Tax=Candidatus Caldatribacterium saccharofermentans TaxID=1454753 RepID=UPI003CFD94A9
MSNLRFSEVSTLEIAKEYLKRGWRPIPVPPKEKAPRIPGWQNLRLNAEDLPQYFNGGGNLGILLGEPSGWLVDLDLDALEALQVAERFLPPTQAVFGRASKPKAHWLYYCPGARTIRFEWRGETLVEIRSTGAQTVFPPSIHPSGEQVRWDEDGDPAPVDFATLKRAVAKLASCVLLARHYPSRGSRQFSTMALSGWLLRCGWTDEEVREFLEALCTLAGDEETRMRLAQVRNTATKVENDLPATGRPTLAQYFPEEVLERVADWLELRKERLDTERPNRPCTDLGNAERLVQHFGSIICYVPEWGWLVWDGKRWVKDTGKQRITKLAEETVRRIYTEAAEASSKEERERLVKWALASENRQRIQAMIDLAAPMVLASAEDFDRDPFLLNCENGVVDLRTGELKPHDPGFYLTKMAPVTYNPTAKAPRWEKFLREIFPGNPELVEFVQRALGYSITGDVREDKFFVCWGRGRNGKSTLLGTVQRVLGDYAKQVAPDALLKRSEKGDAHPTAIADLCGARFTLVQETEEGKHLATAVVKAMTGRDKLKARYMRKDYFEFEPTHKIWLSTNYKPVIGDTTVAMWSRIVLVPFVAFFDEEHQDKTLPEKLWNEREGILRWLVEGCLKWQQEGLRPPQVVIEATKSYQSEMDVLQRWLEECCICDPKAVTPLKELYASYEAWCKENDEIPISKRKFTEKLEEKGFEAVVLTGNQRGRKGIALKEGVNQVNQVNHFPILHSKAPIYKELYRNHVNMINSINSTTPFEETPPTHDFAETTIPDDESQEEIVEITLEDTPPEPKQPPESKPPLYVGATVTLNGVEAEIVELDLDNGIFIAKTEKGVLYGAYTDGITYWSPWLCTGSSAKRPAKTPG